MMEKIVKAKNKILAFITFAVFNANAVVANATKSTSEVGADTKTIVKGVTGVIFQISTVVGVVLIIYSIYQLIMAFKNEDADSKARAIGTLVVGAVLMGLKTICGNISTLNGYV